MKLRKKILLTAGLIGITTPIMAETSYQCLSCPSGTYSVAGSTGIESCKIVGSLTASMYTKTISATQGSCSKGTLVAGQPYRVILRGGKGGNSNDTGANGGFVEYEFIPDRLYAYELCAGSNGYSYYYNAFEGYGAGGGGAGSWIKLNDGIHDYYIAAGGGGGGAFNKKGKNGYNFDAAGGGGGGIGSGGAGNTNNFCIEKSTKYNMDCKTVITVQGGKGGSSFYGSVNGLQSMSTTSTEYQQVSSGGPGLIAGKKGIKGEYCTSISTDDDSGSEYVYSSEGYAVGGQGGGGMYGNSYIIKSECGSLATSDFGSSVSVFLYGFEERQSISLGGHGGGTNNENSIIFTPAPGKASHKTNVSTLSGKCSGTTGCAVLLSL